MFLMLEDLRQQFSELFVWLGFFLCSFFWSCFGFGLGFFFGKGVRTRLVSVKGAVYYHCATRFE